MSRIEKKDDIPGNGLLGNANAMTGDFASYLRLRGELFLLECREARALVGKNIIFLFVAAFCVLVTYFLVLLVLAQLLGHMLAQWSQGPLSNWFGGAAILAIIHFVVAVTLFVITRKTKKHPLFEHTKSEWEKDRQWLHTTNKNPN